MDQTIGITEWRDTARNSYYPFEQDCGVKALFLDATFTQFDGFVPILNSITVNTNDVTFEFQFDTGVYKHVQVEAGCVEGSVIVLKDVRTDRYYGQLVTGPGIIYAYNSMKGAKLFPEIPFSVMVVRAIPRSAGLFAIDQAYNDIEIGVDHSQFFNIVGNSVTWNSVALPSNIPEVKLSSKCLYAVTDKKHILEFNLETKTVKRVFSVAIPLTAVGTSSGKLYGAAGEHYYDLTAVPATALDSDEAVYALTTGRTDESKLFAMVDAGIIQLDPANTGNNLALMSLPGPGKTLTCYADNDKFVYSVPGPFDKQANTTVSDLLYKVDTTAQTSTLVGLVTIAGNMHQPPCAALIKMVDDPATTITAILADSSITKIVKIDLSLGTATLLFSTTTSSTFGTPIAGTDGKNVKVKLRKITPLKKINGVAPVTNALHFIDGGIIHLEKTAADEITINLAPDVADTIIRRSKKYQA